MAVVHISSARLSILGSDITKKNYDVSVIILWFMCLAGAASRCFIVPDIGVCWCLWVIRLWVAMLAEMPDGCAAWQGCGG